MITHWDALPLVLHAEHMAELLGCSVSTVWKKCRAKTIPFQPLSWTAPYLWDRDTVRQQARERTERVRTTRRSVPKNGRPVVSSAARLLALASGELA